MEKTNENMNDVNVAVASPLETVSPQGVQDPIENEAMSSSGVYVELAKLPPNTPIDLKALAKILHRHPHSVKRAVARGELPPGARFIGRLTWTAGAITKHLEDRMKIQAEKAVQFKRQIERLSA